jgi:non-specific serine/threonine protein kinase
MNMIELIKDFIEEDCFDYIMKGKRLYEENNREFVIKTESSKKIHLIVPGKGKNKKYNVVFAIAANNEDLDIECTCHVFDEEYDCEHCAAAALFIVNRPVSAKSKPHQSLRPALIHKEKEANSAVSKPDNSQIGYLFDFSEKKHIRFSLQLLLITEKNEEKTFLKFSSLEKEFPDFKNLLSDDQKEIFNQLSIDYMRLHLLAGGNIQLSDLIARQLILHEKQIETIEKYYHKYLKKLWPFLLKQSNIFTIQKGKGFNAANIHPLQLGDSFPSISFKVTRDEKYISIQLIISIEGEKITHYNSFGQRLLLLEYDKKLFLFNEYDDVKMVQKFDTGVLKFPISEQFDVMLKTVPSLQQAYEVEIDPALTFDKKIVEPQSQVMVAEYLGQYMMLIPRFIYEDTLVEYDNEEDVIIVKNNNDVYLIERNKSLEKEFYEKLRAFHPSFSRQLLKPFYYLPFNEVMKGQWFLKTLRTLQEQDFTVTGIENLKKFRYNTSRPSWNVKTTSGTDWFDMKIVVTFGSQKVLLRDIQKAMKSDQKIVVLSDGSLGVLPEEWLERFGMLMKMGNENNGILRVNKMHFVLVSELHSLIEEKDLLKELEDKKRQLENIEKFESKPLSKKITAQLRPYQLSGFQWMQALDEIGWGGCLADDMGLGKTLQVISFLQFVKEKYPGAVNLVVVPTSLIYNWESELQKFAPSLKYHIHYGSNRRMADEHLEDNDIIITSYGSMRNDIEEFQKYQFQYAILDESQGIKNPGALVTRAAQLLRAKNRIILSGTPVQNNTFDLYAQMNFLNPGFLGNKEFFKSRFADPIDKYGSREKAEELRKMIYPFILRRTKEKVAQDLPDKTETILWCEMGPEQRKVYDDYKNYYRHHLLNRIDESGMNKSAIYVLEGLMRLRQICDSPIMVKDKNVKTTESVKLDELLREVQENTGNHKILVFSQFTGMLKLVEEAFTQQKISNLYLDGSTPAAKRKSLVDQFQGDKKIKAFLISIKAGGVGLNLTAAEYVYLVDPWWNPSVENQAIDRTHRIGQTQKVFAYKMICKDTIEEKILQLQQKKKALSDDLISEEQSFVKKLTKDDVEFLFS